MVIIETLFCIFVGMVGGMFYYGLALAYCPEDFSERIIQYCVAIGSFIISILLVGSKETNFYYTIMIFSSLIPGFIILWFSFKADNKKWINVEHCRK